MSICVRKLGIAGLAAGMALSVAGMGAAQADHRWHGRGVHHHHYYHRDSGGSAVAAGVFGLAAGAIIGSAVSQPRVYAPPPPRVVYVEPAPVYYYGPAPWTPDWYAYCASKYRSFDVHSGTYVSWDGVRRFCR